MAPFSNKMIYLQRWFSNVQEGKFYYMSDFLVIICDETFEDLVNDIYKEVSKVSHSLTKKRLRPMPRS